MSVDDRSISFLPKRKVILPYEMGLLDGAGVHTGAPDLAEVETTGFVGIDLAAAGDMVSVKFPVPVDLDPAFDIKYRVHWTTDSSTTSDTVTWIILDKFLAVGADLAVGDSALDTAIAVDTVTGALDIHVTAAGVRSAANIGLTRAQIAAGAWASVLLEMDATDVDVGSSEQVYLLALEVEYVAKRCHGRSSASRFDFES